MIVNVLLQLLILCYFQPAYSSSLQLSLYLIFMTRTSFKCGGGGEPTHFCCWDSWFWTLSNAQIFIFSQSTHLSTWCRNAQAKAVFNHSSATEVGIQLVLENRLAVMTDFESCPWTFRLPWANNTLLNLLHTLSKTFHFAAFPVLKMKLIFLHLLGSLILECSRV
jgi:hypothetical protein